MPVFSKTSRNSDLSANHSASTSSEPLMGLGGQVVDTGRRMNKSTTSKEKVWPDELEKALLEALAEYKPASGKDPRHLQRFPRRNKFIAQQILRKTGKKRTPKQVGSRLQQLRETCLDPNILHLIQSKDFGDRKTTLDDTSSSSTSPITTAGEWSVFEHSSLASLSRFSSMSSSDISHDSAPTSSTSLPAYSLASIFVVCLILFDFDCCAAAPSTSPSFTLDLDEHALTDYASSPDSSYSTFTRRTEIRAPQAISHCTPVVNFCSQRLLPGVHYQCFTEVYRDEELVYSRPALLERRHLGTESTALSMPLLPDFWAVITSNPEDYRSYSITQKIYPICSGAIQKDFPLFSIHYTMERGFNFPTYVVPEVLPPPPPPYVDDAVLQTGAHSPLHFQYPSPLSESRSASYFDNVPLAYPAPQIPDPLFFTPPSDQDLLSMSHELNLNSFVTYF